MTQQSSHARARVGGTGSRHGTALARVAACVTLGLLTGWAAVGDETRAAADDVVLHRASERLISRCMTRHGFAYAEQPPPPATQRDFRYVLDDVEWARSNGYGPLVGRAGAWNRDVNFANLQRLSPQQQRAWQQALLGSGRQLTADLPDLGLISAPDNGCTAEARRVLYGDLAGWYRVRRIVDHFGSYVATQVTNAAEYRTAFAAWAGCVHGRGYAASTPHELRKLVVPDAAGSTGERPPEREVSAAVTEAECAHSAGLSRAIGALERRYRPQVERRFARELDALKSFEQQAIPKARRILADA